MDFCTDISIIVTTWNRREVLKDAFRSLVEQDYQGRTQVVVCDDGSTDGTEAVIKDYSAKFDEFDVLMERPSYEDRLQTSRLSMIINKALKVCKGRYISYLPDDDLYLPQRNRVMVEFLDEHPGVYLAYHWMKLLFVSSDMAVVGQVVDLCDGWDDGNEYWVRNICNRIDHASIVHRNLGSENIPWDENPRFKRSADWGFLLRALETGMQFGCVQRHLAVGRKIQGQSLNVDGDAMIERLKDGGDAKVDENLFHQPG